jgi:hypothetical protein
MHPTQLPQDTETHLKLLASGAVDCPKACFVAKGYSQVYGVDYDNTYAPVVCMEILCKLLAYAVLHGLAVHLMCSSWWC